MWRQFTLQKYFEISLLIYYSLDFLFFLMLMVAVRNVLKESASDTSFYSSIDQTFKLHLPIEWDLNFDGAFAGSDIWSIRAKLIIINL